MKYSSMMFHFEDRKKTDWFQEKIDRFHLRRFEQAQCAQKLCNSILQYVGFSAWVDFFSTLEKRTNPSEITKKLISFSKYKRRYLEICSLELGDLQDERSYDELLRELFYENSQFQLLFYQWIFKESYLEKDPKEDLLKIAHRVGSDHSLPLLPSLVRDLSNDPKYILHSCPPFYLFQKNLFLCLKKSSPFEDWCTLSHPFTKESLFLYAEYLKGYCKNYFKVEDVSMNDDLQLFFRIEFPVDRSGVNP